MFFCVVAVSGVKGVQNLPLAPHGGRQFGTVSWIVHNEPLPNKEAPTMPNFHRSFVLREFCGALPALVFSIHTYNS
jgi:hypothetical protein